MLLYFIQLSSFWRTQIVDTPLMDTLKVHNAVARVRLKAVGKVIAKIERTSLSLQSEIHSLVASGHMSPFPPLSSPPLPINEPL